MVIVYFIIMAIYIAVYAAYVNTHRDDLNLVSKYGDWELFTMLGISIGALLWPFTVLCYTFYRIAYKFFQKQ